MTKTFKDSHLFVTDFDGTFLKSDYTLCHHDLEAMSKLKRSGVNTVIATGRSVYSFDLAIARLKLEDLPIDYLIFSTGAGILSYKDKRILKSDNIKKKRVEEICSVLEKNRMDYMVHAEIPYTREFKYRLFSHDNMDFMGRINLYKRYCSPVESISDLYDSTEIIVIFTKEKFLAEEKNIMEVLSNFNTVKTTSPLDHDSIWIEILPKNTNKSSAVSWLAERLDINKKNIMAMGNDYNDEDLLSWAETSFITNNGPSDLKNRFINLPSNDMGAVRTAISIWRDKIKMQSE